MQPAYWVEAEQSGGQWLGLSMWERQARAEAEMQRLAEYQRTRRYRVTYGKTIVARANFPQILPSTAREQTCNVSPCKSDR